MTDPVQHGRDGATTPVTRAWVPEVPVALEFNGLAYAVMMATPADLEDFALGFALNEALAAAPTDVTDIAVVEVEHGWIVRAQLTGLGIDKLTDRVRTRVAESSWSWAQGIGRHVLRLQDAACPPETAQGAAHERERVCVCMMCV